MKSQLVPELVIFRHIFVEVILSLRGVQGFCSEGCPVAGLIGFMDTAAMMAVRSVGLKLGKGWDVSLAPIKAWLAVLDDWGLGLVGFHEVS